MILFVFAMRCAPAMAVVRHVTSSRKWPAVQFLYMLLLACGAAFAVNYAVMAIFQNNSHWTAAIYPPNSSTPAKRIFSASMSAAIKR